MKLRAHQRETVPAPPPVEGCGDARMVLAGKGSLRRTAARPCLLRSVPADLDYATGGSGGNLLKQERIRLLVDTFDDDPKAKELVRLQLDPEGYNAFTNKELAELLETSIGDIENRKKRVKNRLLQILRRQKKGTRTYA